ncbi:MAG: hypothetical protein M3Q44_03540 [bacterium]|nr:hypothetical protein [bacterium]
MSDSENKVVDQPSTPPTDDCACENGDCECCKEGCACPNEECLCGWDEEDTQGEKYALLAEEAYEELIKEKLKKKFMESEQNLDKVVDIAYRAAMHRWDELDRGEYDGEVWEKFEEELKAVWKK